MPKDSATDELIKAAKGSMNDAWVPLGTAIAVVKKLEAELEHLRRPWQSISHGREYLDELDI